MKNFMKLIAVAVVATAATAGAQGAAKGEMAGSKTSKTSKTAEKSTGYKKDLPDSLIRDAKVTEAAASVTALAKVPNGKISSVEIERENGKLIYSYDIKVPGKKGIEEVNIDAMTGATVGGVEHEKPATEKKEAAAEAKEKKMAPKAKKPPV